MLGITMMAMLSVNLSACSSDDDEDDNTIVGSWIREETYDDWYFSEILTFKSDKTGTETKNYRTGSYTDSEVNPFTYTPTSSSEGTMVVRDGEGSDEVDSLYYVIKNGNLYIGDIHNGRRDELGSHYYTKQ